MRTLKELSQVVGGEVAGQREIKISGVNNLSGAKEGEISFILDHKNIKDALLSSASAFIVQKEIKEIKKPQIITNNVKLSYAKILHLFQSSPERKGIHPTAVISKSAIIEGEVSVGAHCYIGEGAKIKNKVIIYPGVYIGDGVEVSEGSIIYPNVVIQDDCFIGKKVIIHSGVVIGGDGFGFVKDENNHHFKIPQVGKVVIEDEVEIGANTCVDRASFGLTKIGRGTKIDNLVQVGHNVIIGEDCIIVSQVGISGSVNIGNRCILAGQSGVKDHVTIGDDSKILGRAGVLKDVPEKSIYYGMPAGPHIEQKRLEVLVRRLPQLFEKIKEQQK